METLSYGTHKRVMKLIKKIMKFNQLVIRNVQKDLKKYENVVGYMHKNVEFSSNGVLPH